MPGSEYYDRDPTPAEMEITLQFRRKEKEGWEKTLADLRKVSFRGNRKLEQKLEDIEDFIKARISEIRV